jgi:hypothetical protein
LINSRLANLYSRGIRRRGGGMQHGRLIAEEVEEGLPVLVILKDGVLFIPPERKCGRQLQHIRCPEVEP